MSSTSINSIRRVFYDEFAAGWSGETAPFTRENEKFDPPAADPWVRISVRNKLSNQETLGMSGNRKFLRRGAFYAQVFIPTSAGLFESDRLTALVRNIYEGRRITAQLWITDVVIQEIGPQGEHFQSLVEVNFTYEDIK